VAGITKEETTEDLVSVIDSLSQLLSTKNYQIKDILENLRENDKIISDKDEELEKKDKIIKSLENQISVSVGVANFFLGQSIGNDETNTFQLTFFSSMNIVGATGLGCLWALEWAWQKGKLVIILKFKTIEHVCDFNT